MSITISNIQSLLSTYHKQQAQSRLSEARVRQKAEGSDAQEDKVFISAEAKRIQVYQETARDVLKRLRIDSQTAGRDADDAPQAEGQTVSGQPD
jgi:ABC-type enterochelin transport system substrate-binding protein